MNLPFLDIHIKEFELEPGEHVVLETRKHWFIFLAELLPYAILAVVPFAAAQLIPLFPPLAPLAPYFDLSISMARIVLGVWLLIAWTSAWGTFTKYYLNAWILTNKRIVDIKQRGYFDREVSSLFLSRVQDATTDVRGVLHSFLGIGNINVQTAATTERFDMHDIPEPEAMRDTILRYVDEASKGANN